VGWKVRHGADLSAATLLVVGGLVATAVHVLVDVLVHRHREG